MFFSKHLWGFQSRMKLTVGEYLRKTRQEKNLAIEEAAQATRVRLTYLRALENDDDHILPSRVQARGYLRMYADYLKLDPAPILAAWPDKTVDLDELEPEPADGQEAQPEPPAAKAHAADKSPAEEEILSPEEELTEAEVKDFPEEEAANLALPVAPPTGSHSIYIQLGEELRARREMLGLSIGDVERFTRLRSHYITALEEGRLEDIPSLVQGRGMLSNYAEFLNMDTEAVLLRFADALQTRRIEKSQPTGPVPKAQPVRKSPKPTGPPAVWKRFLTPDLLIGGGMFILLIAFVIWGAARVTDLRRQEAQITPMSLSEILISTSDADGLSGLTLTPQISPTPTPNNLAVVPTSFPEEGENGNVQSPPVSTSNDPIQVYIVANQRAWMRVTVDNRVVFEGRVVPGNAYPFTGRQQIELVTGNGAALQVVYNQNNLGALGVLGEVIQLIFTEDGTLVPTPQFTLTPTATLQPTETPRPTPTAVTPTITPFVP